MVSWLPVSWATLTRPVALTDNGSAFKTTVTAAGQHNAVIGGDQDFTINGGQGFDRISVGNGTNTIKEAGVQDSITVGGGANKITDLGGHATVTVLAPIFDDAPVVIKLGGTNNTVTGLGNQDFHHHRYKRRLRPVYAGQWQQRADDRRQ